MATGMGLTRARYHFCNQCFVQVIIFANQPSLYTQVLFVDGNGTLHPRRFGLACHLGVLADLPTIGIGKNFLQISDEGEQLTMDNVKKMAHDTLLHGGQWFPLVGKSGLVYGAVCM
jgi:deoxyinosine 3'endonuclease (endonuclease V)